MNGKSGRNGFSAVGPLFSDSLLGTDLLDKHMHYRSWGLKIFTSPRLRFQDFQRWKTVPKTFPLIPRIRGQSVLPLTPLAIHKALKAFFSEVACFLREGDSEALEKLARASTHWLRHTHGTHAVDMNSPLTVVRDNLGHSSIAITSQYVHADKDARHSAISEMLGQSGTR